MSKTTNKIDIPGIVASIVEGLLDSEGLVDAATERVLERVHKPTLEEIASGLDVEELAKHIDESSVAYQMCASDIAEYIDTDGVAGAISHYDIAESIDPGAIAESIDLDDLAARIDMDALAQMVADLVTKED